MIILIGFRSGLTVSRVFQCIRLYIVLFDSNYATAGYKRVKLDWQNGWTIPLVVNYVHDSSLYSSTDLAFCHLYFPQKLHRR